MMEYIEDDLFIIYIEDAPLGLETIENLPVGKTLCLPERRTTHKSGVILKTIPISRHPCCQNGFDVRDF